MELLTTHLIAHTVPRELIQIWQLRTRFQVAYHVKQARSLALKVQTHQLHVKPAHLDTLAQLVHQIVQPVRVERMQLQDQALAHHVLQEALHMLAIVRVHPVLLVLIQCLLVPFHANSVLEERIQR